MTVLMFGWEFPPHISGGLGTACLGLASALTRQGVKLLFVVPKAQGDEAIPLISASDVFVRGDEMVETPIGEGQNRMRVLTVASTMKPYAMATSSVALEEWNWQFDEGLKKTRTSKGIKYNFSGQYGPSLMSEVQRYSEVARVVAGTHVFDVIHAHDWLTYRAGIAAKRVSGKPLVVHVHATEYDRAGEKNLDHRVLEIEMQGMEEADHVITVSQWTKDILVSKYHVVADKITVVHNGIANVASPDFSSIPKIGNQVVTFLGRITYQKGPWYFIEAAKKVLAYAPDVHFVIAGSGDLLPEMIDRVAALKLSSRIHFTGFLKGRQLERVWSVTDVYVMPSVSEPFGIAPLEAIRAGVPVIVSRQSGVSEVIDHALKVDFWDTNALANSIISVLRYKSLSESLRANSTAEIESLTWERAATKINQLYDAC